MTVPLRTPPVVTREVAQTRWIRKNKIVRTYTEGPSPAPTDGPPILYVHHTGDHGVEKPEDCEMCGRQLAYILTSQLHVGE